MWQQIQQFHPALALRAERPLGAHQHGGVLLDESKLHLIDQALRERLAIKLVELRLRIVKIPLTRRAIEKHKDAVLQGSSKIPPDPLLCGLIWVRGTLIGGFPADPLGPQSSRARMPSAAGKESKAKPPTALTKLLSKSHRVCSNCSSRTCSRQHLLLGREGDAPKAHRRPATGRRPHTESVAQILLCGTTCRACRVTLGRSG